MSHSPASITNALTFDIEDWFHMVEIDAVADTKLWPTLPSIVEKQTHWILDTLDEHKTKATFFVLGWIADRYPQLVRDIAFRGHELATHSFWHQKVYEMSPDAFRADLKQSIEAIENAASQRVRGYRAPSFSITPGSEWALDVLLDESLTYDASLFPASRGHGGYPCTIRPHQFTSTPSGRPITELPMSVMSFCGKKLAFSGGGYLRLLPQRIIAAGFDQLHAANVPVVVYLHPRDFDVDCPRVPMPLSRRFKCYVGLKTTRDKLRWMLKTYKFDSCEAVLQSHAK